MCTADTPFGRFLAGNRAKRTEGAGTGIPGIDVRSFKFPERAAVGDPTGARFPERVVANFLSQIQRNRFNLPHLEASQLGVQGYRDPQGRSRADLIIGPSRMTTPPQPSEPIPIGTPRPPKNQRPR